MKLSGRQATAARNLLGLTQAELAASCAVSLVTIARFEADMAIPHRKNLERIQRELEDRGIEFTNGDGVGVRLNYAKAAAYAKARQAEG